jgi:hypothetical protein
VALCRVVACAGANTCRCGIGCEIERGGDHSSRIIPTTRFLHVLIILASPGYAGMKLIVLVRAFGVQSVEGIRTLLQRKRGLLQHRYGIQLPRNLKDARDRNAGDDGECAMVAWKVLRSARPAATRRDGSIFAKYGWWYAMV